MKFGVNTFLFVSPFTNESTKLFKNFKDWGFDSVEIPVEQVTDWDPAYVKGELDKYGLVCGSVCAVYGPDRDLRGNPEQQKNSLDYIKTLVDFAVTLQAPTVIGPHYSSVGRADLVTEKERKSQWKLVVKNLKTVCKYAEKKGICLALEPLNRFETDFINTCDQALKMVKDVGSPALKVHLDTFHMNIEEKDLAKAILKAGKQLGHLHACGSDRGQPGNDHTDWESIAAALKKVKYDGNVVIESFTPGIEMIAKAASIWRMYEPSQKDIAVKGLKFLRQALR